MDDREKRATSEEEKNPEQSRNATRRSI